MRSRFQGLRVIPVSGEWQTPIQPYSGSVVLPSTMAPCSRRRATAGASAAAAGAALVVSEPLRDGRPLTSILSLTVAGRPSSRPCGSPLAQRACERARRQRAVAVDRDESVDLRLETLDARERVLHDFDRRQFAPAVEPQQVAAAQLRDFGGHETRACGSGPGGGRQCAILEPSISNTSSASSGPSPCPPPPPFPPPRSRFTLETRINFYIKTIAVEK